MTTITRHKNKWYINGVQAPESVAWFRFQTLQRNGYHVRYAHGREGVMWGKRYCSIYGAVTLFKPPQLADLPPTWRQVYGSMFEIEQDYFGSVMDYGRV